MAGNAPGEKSTDQEPSSPTADSPICDAVSEFCSPLSQTWTQSMPFGPLVGSRTVPVILIEPPLVDTLCSGSGFDTVINGGAPGMNPPATPPAATPPTTTLSCVNHQPFAGVCTDTESVSCPDGSAPGSSVADQP